VQLPTRSNDDNPIDGSHSSARDVMRRMLTPLWHVGRAPIGTRLRATS
jgi:hypothetical protein